jgi:tRNA-(ms[2]io[6]A)-hydroxylase
MLCLTVPTDPAWITHAMSNLGALLVDHAHCELKAASNALSLAARYAEHTTLVLALTDLAKDEIDHYQRVVKMVAARGLSLGAPPVDPYAKDLRQAAHVTTPRRVAADVPRWFLCDRLLIGALIEARSCERFKLIVDALEEAQGQGKGDAELHAFYTELFACEARHFRVYTDLAKSVMPGSEAEVLHRLDELAQAEGRIVSGLLQLPVRAMVHG